MMSLEQLLILERKIQLFDRLLERAVITEDEHGVIVAAVSDTVREGLNLKPRLTLTDPKVKKP